jgi:hypothetical protein
MQIDNAYGQHINVLKHFVNVKDGWGKQFELAVSLNRDIMTSFDSTTTSDSEPQNLSLLLWVKQYKATTVCQ